MYLRRTPMLACINTVTQHCCLLWPIYDHLVSKIIIDNMLWYARRMAYMMYIMYKFKIKEDNSNRVYI